MKRTSKTYRIEKSREMRLWLRDFVIPATGAVVTLAANPQVAAWVDYKKEQAKAKIEKIKHNIKVAK